MIWTRAHQKCLEAAAVLALGQRLGLRDWSFGQWLNRKFGVNRVAELTVSQARQARRCLNAWRGWDTGVTT